MYLLELKSGVARITLPQPVVVAGQLLNVTREALEVATKLPREMRSQSSSMPCSIVEP